jgi:hypothetical protein
MNRERWWKDGVLIKEIVDGREETKNLGMKRQILSVRKGTGDKIASFAQPIAKLIDKVAGTKIAGCKGCKKMKRRLNAGMPLSGALRKRIQGN